MIKDIKSVIWYVDPLNLKSVPSEGLIAVTTCRPESEQFDEKKLCMPRKVASIVTKLIDKKMYISMHYSLDSKTYSVGYSDTDTLLDRGLDISNQGHRFNLMESTLRTTQGLSASDINLETKSPSFTSVTDTEIWVGKMDKKVSHKYQTKLISIDQLINLNKTSRDIWNDGIWLEASDGTKVSIDIQSYCHIWFAYNKGLIIL